MLRRAASYPVIASPRAFLSDAGMPAWIDRAALYRCPAATTITGAASPDRRAREPADPAADLPEARPPSPQAASAASRERFRLTGRARNGARAGADAAARGAG